jgi:antitoxin component of MazEF toxin-antitoxin module
MLKKQTRKVVKIGNSLHVSLPAEYLNAMGLAEGDLIMMGLTVSLNLILWNPIVRTEKTPRAG